MRAPVPIYLYEQGRSQPFLVCKPVPYLGGGGGGGAMICSIQDKVRYYKLSYPNCELANQKPYCRDFLRYQVNDRMSYDMMDSF